MVKRVKLERRRVRTISKVETCDYTRVKLEAEEEAMARARELGCHDVHTHEMDGRTVYMPCYTHERYENMLSKQAEDKKDDTVISTREESGITTETRQYKKKKYNPGENETGHSCGSFKRNGFR